MAEHPINWTPGSLAQKVEDVDRDAKEGHDRNHERFDQLSDRVEALDAIVGDQNRRLSDLAERVTGNERRSGEDRRAPVEASQLRFTSQLVLWVVIGIGALVTGPWFLNQGLRNDVASILVRMGADSKLQEERNETLRLTIDAIDKEQKLQRLKLESLAIEVLKLSKER